MLLVAAVGGVVLGSHARQATESRCTGLTSSGTSSCAALLFATGALGVMLRRNPLIILLSVEIMLNSANLLLIAMSRAARRARTARSSRSP